MVDEQDWKVIVNSSEVFRGYVASELQREAQARRAEASEKIAEMEAAAAQRKDEDEKKRALAAFEKAWEEMPADVKAKIKQARDYLAVHPEAHDKVDPNFIRAVTMLNLKDGDDS